MKGSNYKTKFFRYIHRVGIQKHISPHSLRNNLAKYCLVLRMDAYTANASCMWRSSVGA